MSRRRIGVLSTLLALVPLAIGATGVAADTRFSHSGTYGRHYLADNEDNPNVHCRYGAGSVLRSVRVESPFVFARNSTANRDRQLTGWRFRVQRQPVDDGPWTTILSTGVQREWAFDDIPAPFGPKFTTINGSGAFNYRILVAMFWYRTSGDSTPVVVGASTHIADWYHGAAFEPSLERRYCPGGVF